MLKKLIALSLLAGSTQLYAHELHDYAQIKSAIISGKTIHMVFDYSKCTPADANHAQYMGTFTPNEMLIKNDNYITTSLLHFTLSNPDVNYRPIYEFNKYVITMDNNLTWTHQILDAPTYTPMGDKTTTTCQIDAGVKFYT